MVKQIQTLTIHVCLKNNTHSHPSGCYGVANAHGPCLLPIDGLHITGFQLKYEVFKSINCMSGFAFPYFFLSSHSKSLATRPVCTYLLSLLQCPPVACTCCHTPYFRRRCDCKIHSRHRLRIRNRATDSLLSLPS